VDGKILALDPTERPSVGGHFSCGTFLVAASRILYFFGNGYN